MPNWLFAFDKVCFGVHQGQMLQKYGSPLKQRHITDYGVRALAEGCPALRVLGLGGCINVTVSPIRSVRTQLTQCYSFV